jgi:hypothetical protein
MKKYILLAAVAVLAYWYFQYQEMPPPGSTSTMAAEIALQTAFANGESDIQVKGAGKVTRVLSDDLDGSRHQRFIVMLAWGDTLLISHNIDLAPRIDELRVGDAVEFFGEYEWNDKGGVVHWTHHDPAGRHVAGWVRHLGKTYQ